MRGMSTLSSDRLNLARKDHKVVARAQLFREHSRMVHHVLITVASSSSKFELLKYGKAHCKIPPTVRSMQSSDLYRSKISNQPTFKGKCVRSMEKERWVTVWFDDGVGNLKVVEITCTTTNAVVTPASWLPISYSRRFTITDPAEFFPNVSWKTVHRIVTENLHFRKLCDRCRGGNDNKQFVATTGGRLFRHKHSKTCDAIQVPRFC